MRSLPIERDERTEAVENASYRLAYMLISFGILLDVMYRSGRLHQPCWDLFALVIVSGAAGRAYQARQHALGPGWARKAALVIVIAAFVGAVAALMVR
ncbi:MAG TPA: hypothetical protein VGM51_05075 [Armatimonadota bacterium]|jgi:hypothetical protein